MLSEGSIRLSSTLVGIVSNSSAIWNILGVSFMMTTISSGQRFFHYVLLLLEARYTFAVEGRAMLARIPDHFGKARVLALNKP